MVNPKAILAAVKAGLAGLKIVVFIVLLILSIVLLASASKAVKETSGATAAKAKALLTFSVFLFVMTLTYPLLTSKFPGQYVLAVYFVLSIIAMSLAIPVANASKSTAATNAKRSATGLFVMNLIFLAVIVLGLYYSKKFPFFSGIAKMLV